MKNIRLFVSKGWMKFGTFQTLCFDEVIDKDEWEETVLLGHTAKIAALIPNKNSVYKMKYIRLLCVCCVLLSIYSVYYICHYGAMQVDYSVMSSCKNSQRQSHS